MATCKALAHEHVLSAHVPNVRDFHLRLPLACLALMALRTSVALRFVLNLGPPGKGR